MASPTSVSSDPVKQSGELSLDASTPPEKRSVLPLTPPASTERHAPGLDVEGLMKIFEGCRDHSDLYTSAAPIKLQPRYFRQLTKALECNPLLDSYVQDKLR
jgi:hypothetical protein